MLEKEIQKSITKHEKGSGNRVVGGMFDDHS